MRKLILIVVYKYNIFVDINKQTENQNVDQILAENTDYFKQTALMSNNNLLGVAAIEIFKFVILFENVLNYYEFVEPVETQRKAPVAASD